jgi:hypothetical protein
VSLEHSLDQESRTAIFLIFVSSVDDDDDENAAAQAGPDDEGAASESMGVDSEPTKPEPKALQFELTAVAAFTCTDFPDADKALTEFASSDTPALLAWPYIRSFVAEMVTESGLPEYHLPLAQISASPEQSDDANGNSAKPDSEDAMIGEPDGTDEA